MKTRNLIIVALSLISLSLISCSKENALDNSGSKEVKFEEFSIDGILGGQTKTHIADSFGKVHWDEGDCISVFSADVESPRNNKFESSYLDKGQALFSGLLEETTSTFYALYPYSSELVFKDSVIFNALIPEEQEAVNGSFQNGAALALAKGKKTPGSPVANAVQFQNLCSVLSFVLPEGIDFADEIIITSKSGAAMSGKVWINSNTMSIDSASVASVKLTGDFKGGDTYYITVAPGTYADGFKFTIKSKDGFSYSRQTTKTAVVNAGTIYPLGTLCVILSEENFNCSLEIEHDIEDGVLYGSFAKVSLALDEDFAPLIRDYSATVTVVNDDVVYRSSTYTDTKVENDTLEVCNDLFYIPSGYYDYIVTVKYVSNSDVKGAERTVIFGGNTASSQPYGINLKTKCEGYTSYSVYKGLDEQTASTEEANMLDGSTIYEINSVYDEGLSDVVYAQCSDMIITTVSLDGIETTPGDKNDISWGMHTISGYISFDGIENFEAKDVCVSGLPFNTEGYLKNTESHWHINGSKYDWQGGGYLTLWTGGNATSDAFFVEESTDISLSYRMGLYSGGGISSRGHIALGDKVIIDKGYTAFTKTNYYLDTVDLVLDTPSSLYVKGYSNSAIATRLSTWAEFFYIRIFYK